VAPDEPSEPPGLIVVTGGDRTGKSAVVRAALPACHARGCDIAYIDFGPSTRLAWFAAIRRVHDDLRAWLPEHDDLMRHFAHVAETSRIAPYSDGAAQLRTFGDDLRFENENDVGDHRKKVIFRELRNLIRACAGDSRLLLVFDHLFTGLSDEAREDYILPRLVQPLLDEVPSNVVLVAVVPKNQTLALSLSGGVPDPVEVPDFEKPVFELLLREYVARTGLAGRLQLRQKLVVKTLADAKDTWEVKDLKTFGLAASAAR
jgi:hypothetical protein